jgi:hypothetical protein
MDIFEALEQAADLRQEANDLNRRAAELEHEWVGIATEETLTLKTLVEVIRKVGQVR